MKQTFTREEILDALSVKPCHITGTHRPEHHLESTCDHQRADAFGSVLELIGASEDEIPHKLHDETCFWCHDIPSQEKYRESRRRTHEWAGVPVPEEMAAPAKDAPCFDASEKSVMKTVRQICKEDESGLAYNLHIADKLDTSIDLILRPMKSLEEAGKIETVSTSYRVGVRPT